MEILGGHIGVVFYDVTTLYFETDRQDDLRKTGFSKEASTSTISANLFFPLSAKMHPHPSRSVKWNMMQSSFPTAKLSVQQLSNALKNSAKQAVSSSLQAMLLFMKTA